MLPGPTRSEGVDEFVKKMAKDQGKSPEQVEKEFFQTVRPSSLLQRFATNEEVANLVTYVARPAVLRDQRRGAARRWRRGAVDFVAPEMGPMGLIGR